MQNTNRYCAGKRKTETEKRGEQGKLGNREGEGLKVTSFPEKGGWGKRRKMQPIMGDKLCVRCPAARTLHFNE